MGKQTEIPYLIVLFGSIGILLMALMVVAFVLIYQRKLLEQQQLRQKQEAQAHELQRLQEQEHQRLLLQAVVEAQEKEQRRIAQDLHDELGPMLAVIKMQISELEFIAADKPDVIDLSKKLSAKISDAIDSIRHVSHDLLPAIVDEFGLMKALAALAGVVSSTPATKLSFSTNVTERLPVSKRQEMMLYRIVQELVHNSLKHAQASVIDISLTVNAGELQLRYSDNGCGFSMPQSGSRPAGFTGLGLRNLEARLSVLGGTSHIITGPGKGFTYIIHMPVSEPNE